ncbi:MAG: hypothetical protein MJE77_13320 [Proteobacteria bacterium]|nr:hypothetical protein [Pseudomonadota bacterium]
MFTAFASQPQCVMESSSTPAARMEVFYLPVRGAEEMPRKQLVGLLVFVLKYKTGSVAESSVRTDDSMNEPTRTSASGHLSEKIRVAHRTTLPRRLEPNSVNHYSFALEIREDKSGKWRRHWVLLRVGHEILYIVLGVPGDHTPHNQQLVALMDSIVLRSSQDQPGSASNSQEEPRDEQ